MQIRVRLAAVKKPPAATSATGGFLECFLFF